MGAIETDYLVVGAGAAGMAFVDALIAASDTEVLMVDRRHGPGGHWNDAYPFVRLHGPSALYGVNSRRLGTDEIDQGGPNAGYYPRAEDVTDLFRRLEACGQLIRLDPGFEPTMFRCATVSQDELVRLRSIKNVIRLGRVTRIGPDQIELADGSIPADRGQVQVDCTAAGLSTKPARPVFNGDLITLQQIRACQPVFSAALTGYVEATRDGDARKNLACPANRYPDAAVDWIPLTCTAQRAEIIWATDPDLSAWMQRSRLNATCGMGDHQADPLMASALARLFTNIEPAISKLDMLMAGTGAGSAAR